MATTTKSKLSLNVQHDYITLRTPNGNFTMSFGGYRASGKLASHPTAFNAIMKFLKEHKGTNIEQMTDLTKEEILSTLYPEWNASTSVNYGVGDMVRFTSPHFVKTYPATYKVLEMKMKKVIIDLNGRRTRVNAAEFVNANN
jgi:hypothetical protein